MQEVLLLAAVAATFAFGWFLMGKLDYFLEENRRVREPQFSPSGGSLRLVSDLENKFVASAQAK